MKALRSVTRTAIPVSLLAMVAFAMLWRGGKGLEATWLLAGLTTVIMLASVWLRDFSNDIKRDVQPVVWWALVIFLVWSGISLLLSTTQNYGLDEILRDGSYVLIFLWTARYVSNEDGRPFLKHFANIVTICLLIACAMGMAVYVFQPVSRFVGTFLDMRFHTDYWPNAWAQMILLAWPFAVISTRKQWPLVRAIVLGIVFGCLYLSYSRGGFLAFVGQLVLFGVLEGMSMYRLRRNVREALVPGLTMLCALVAGFAIFTAGNVARSTYFSIESVAEKATFTAAEGSSSINERREFWNAAMTLTLEKPVFGWGPYSFRFVQPRYQTDVLATSDHPHNLFFKEAMERGIPAALLLAFVLASILGCALLREWKGRHDETIGFSEAALVAVCGVLAHNMIDFNLQFVGIGLPFWMLLGVLAPKTALKPAARNAVRVSVLLITVILGCTAVLEGEKLLLSSLGRHAEAVGDANEALYWYKESENEFFSRDMHLGRANLLIQQKKYDEARAVLDLYAKDNEQDARLWILRGGVEMDTGNMNEAKAMYTKALELGKYDYLIAFEGLLRSIGDRPSRATLEEIHPLADVMFEKYGTAIAHNVHFIALSDNVEILQRVAVRLKRFYPQEAGHYDALLKEAVANATKERAANAERTPGMLW